MFAADEQKTPRYGMGASVNFEAFDAGYGATGKKVIPAGTVVTLTETGVGPAEQGQSDRTFITANSAVQGGSYAGSGTVGLYDGGRFFEDRLPQAADGELPEELKTALGERFRFQKVAGTPVTTPPI